MVSFALLFELPSPAEDVESLPKPGDQSRIGCQAGLAIHATGVGDAVGKAAFEADFGIWILIQKSFFFRFIHNVPGNTPKRTFQRYLNEITRLSCFV